MANFFNDDADIEEIDLVVEHMLQQNQQGANIRINQDGSERKVDRDDYSRGPKRPKSDTPWLDCRWLLNLQDDEIKDPGSRLGKEFRRKFRVPHPVFVQIIRNLKFISYAL